MWYKQEIVALIFKKDSLYIFWLQSSKKERVVIPRAWQKYTLDMPCLDEKSLYNHSYIASCLKAFFTHYKISKAFVACALSQEIIWEQYTWYEQDSDNAFDSFFSNPHQLLWNYCSISRNHTENKNLIYSYGISRSLLFQFQLLSLSVPFNCIFLSSINSVLLHLISINNSSVSTIKYDQANEYLQHYKKIIETFEYQFQTDSSSFYELLHTEAESVYTAIGLYDLGRRA